jgi:hypothetical protein
MNTRILGIFCVIGGLTYLAGGVWLATAGAPADPIGVRFAHVFSLIWAIGGLCGLLGMLMTCATGTGRTARATLGLPAIGLSLVVIDAVMGLVASSPLSPFTDLPSPLSAISRFLLLIGFLVVTVFVLRAKRWTGWSRFAPPAVLLAPFVGILFGSLLGIAFFQLVFIGLSWALIGLAVQTQQSFHLEAAGA